MAMRVDCPMEGCHASIEAETKDEVMEQVADHAESAHPDLELDEETVSSIEAQIREI